MENIMLPSPHRILKILKETQAEYTFRVEFDGETSHGQFFQLSIPKIGEAPISVSGKGDGYVEFTIRKIGRLTEGIFGLSEGDMLFMRGPYGNSFPIDEFEGKNLVFICGGTGMAPIKTTINYFYDNPNKCKDVYIIGGFKDINAVLFTEEIKKFSERFNTTWCLDDSEAEGFKKGMVTKFIPDIPFKDFDDYAVIIVGPPVMMKFAAAECLNQGAEEKNIWVSYERKMSCAVGKCGHCKINETYVCLEGPVFNYTRAKDLMD
ncbi:MAG: anaerobic sulfite reductase subunit AsrB [Eubacterium sp.]|nr:anaerobic sulfite reductase subunit AsrB [Eubacterium sp.]